MNVAAETNGEPGDLAGAPAEPVLPTAAAGAPQPPRPPPPARAGYLARHWRGELSLASSYWVSSLLATAAVAAAFWLGNAVPVTRFPRLHALAGMAAWGLACAGQVWLLVGIWRSAGRSPDRGGSVLLARLARGVVVLGWLALAGTLLDRAGPQVLALARIAFGPAESGRFEVRVLRDGTELEVLGAIGFGASEEVERQLRANPSVRLIHLNSEGGRVAEAQRLGEIVEARRLVTYVSSQCLSACVLPFAAGQQRWISREARIGLHQASFPGMTPVEIARSNESAVGYLVSRGVKRDFAARGMATPGDDMWFPSHQEVFRSGLATGYADPGGVAISGIGRSALGTVERDLLRIPLYAVLREHEPDLYGRVVAAIQEGVERGRSLDEVRAGTMPLVLQAYQRSLPHASDAALRRFAEVLVRQMQALQDQDPQACAALLQGGGSAREQAKLPKELRQAELEVAAEVIRSSRADPRPTPDAAAVEPQLAQVFGRVRRRYADAARLFQDPAYGRGKPAAVCGASLTMYREILRLSEAQAGATLRFMFAAN